MTPVRELHNIGKNLANKLELVNITSLEDLKECGSQNAFIKLSAVTDAPCINILYALEGAIQGVRWHQLSNIRKAELKEFYHFCRT